jgi:hypothetical protein
MKPTVPFISSFIGITTIITLLLYCFVQRLSFNQPFLNLIDYLIGNAYDMTLLILTLPAGLSLIILLLRLGSTSKFKKDSSKQNTLLQASDGMQIQIANQKRVAYLRELLQEELLSKPKVAQKLPLDTGLDMSVAG